jgi:hypothetical protein
MKFIKIDEQPYRHLCVYCKKCLTVKSISCPVEDDLSQVLFLESHKTCSLVQFEKCVLDNEITQVKKHLIKLQRKRATLEYKQFLKSGETIADI